jgi:hypothetical protein
VLLFDAAAAATALGASAASAEPPTIPPEFWGEWCTPQRDPNDANKSWYTLPSQTKGGLRAGTTDTGPEYCRPTEIEFTKNDGPSGTTYTIKVTAAAFGCSDRRVTAACFRMFGSTDEVKTFEICRDHQGRLSVTNLSRN